MGFKTFGFGGGREDVWEPEEDIYWGTERQVARRQALHRRPGTRESPRRRADGPDLREPGRAERQPGSARRRPGHPRDLRAHGDERRRDRRADRRRPHLRQDPRRRRCVAWWARSPKPPASRSRASAGRAASARGKGGDTITSGLEGAWTTTPTKWSNNFFWNLFGYEWELTKSPAGAHQWTPKDGAGAGTVPDAHDPSKRHAPTMLTTRPRAAVRPGLREDLAALPREPGSVRRRLRPGVVQADAPRHGPALALSRPGGPGGRADLAGPRPRRRSQADRRDRTSPPSRPRSSPRGCRSRNWSRPPGRRPPPSAAPTSAAARTGRAFASRRRRIGKSTSRPSWRRCWRPSRASRRSSTARSPAGRRSRSPT